MDLGVLEVPCLWFYWQNSFLIEIGWKWSIPKEFLRCCNFHSDDIILFSDKETWKDKMSVDRDSEFLWLLLYWHYFISSN